jgi:membrane dipeptidase
LRVWADADAVATWMHRKGALPLEDDVRHPWE